MSIEFKIEKNIKAIYHNDKLIEENRETTKIIVYFNNEIINQIEQSKDKSFYLEDFKNTNFTNELVYLNSHKLPLGLYIACSFNSSNSKIDFVNFFKKSDNQIKINIPLFFYFDEWNKPFFFPDFMKIYKAELDSKGYKLEEFEDAGYFGLNVEKSFDDDIIFNTIENFASTLFSIEELITSNLSRLESEKFLTKIFNFPIGYEYICSQYLISFGEFLSNLGVDASVSTENKNSRTIIKITSSEDILKNIETALYAYLSMPYIENLPAIQSDSLMNNIINSSLSSQIDFFKAQINMKNIVIKMNNSTISELETENSELIKQNTELNNAILINSLENEDLDKIKLFNDSITISEFKKGPLTVSPKKMFDGIKLMFNKKHNKY